MIDDILGCIHETMDNLIENREILIEKMNELKSVLDQIKDNILPETTAQGMNEIFEKIKSSLDWQDKMIYQLDDLSDEINDCFDDSEEDDYRDFQASRIM